MPRTEKRKAKSSKKPSLRRLKLAKILSENIGISIRKAMIKAGYSEQYANNPQMLKESAGWQQLLDKYLPETKILKFHDELLTSATINHYVFSNALTDKEIAGVVGIIAGSKLVLIKRNPQYATAYFTVPDNHSRKDGVDMAYKLRGSYKAEKVEHSLNEAAEAALARLNALIPNSK